MSINNNEPLEWKFQQVFGDKGSTENPPEADTISAIEFDDTGNFLAIGDRGGRVVLLERNSGKNRTKGKGDVEFKVLTEFQSHEPEFDYLKSLEIEEKINQIRWCKKQNNAHFLLTTNDKTIKLWKVYDKKIRKFTPSNGSSNKLLNGGIRSAQDLKVPKPSTSENVISHKTRKVFGNGHAYHINSLSLNSDGETFLSADDLRINLWHLEHTEQSMNVVDIKPANMEDLTEVITSASFHPTQCNMFMYSSSKGAIKMGDIRTSLRCTKYAKVFEVQEDPTAKTFFSEIISSVSDARFSPDGRYIVSRDYMTLKIWDINMESRPVKVLNVHETLRSRLCELYDNDCIFDKFECCFNGDGSHVVTGSYKNQFHVFDRTGKQHTSVEASRTQPKRKPSGASSSSLTPTRRLFGLSKKEDFEVKDFSKKTLHISWHPTENIIAIGAVNNLYIYSA